MFHHYEDHRFKKIIDEFILSSTADDNKQLSCALRYIDHQAAKLGVSFYQMLFLLIQKDSNENRREKKEIAY